MQKVNLRTFKAEAVSAGVMARKFFNTEKLQIVNLLLEPGKEVAPHLMPMQVVFFVLEGNGSIFIDNKNYDAIEGDFFGVEPGLMRGWKNTSDKLLSVLVLKSF